MEAYDLQKRAIAYTMQLVRDYGVDTKPFSVPTPHFPPEGGLQSARDIIELLDASHYRIVFFNGAKSEIRNWIAHGKHLAHTRAAILGMQDQVPWNCMYIGLYFVNGDKTYECLNWYAKHTDITHSWRKAEPPQ